jgi:phosphate transport system substrate-binding protein
MKTNLRFIAALLLLPLLTNACGQITASANDGLLKGTISVSGAFAVYPLMTRWAEEYQHINPGVRFDISSGGAGRGMQDVLANQVDIGMVSREVTPEEETQGAYPLAVARDAVFALVNAENPALDDLLTHGLTQETLNKIFITGQIKSWGEAIGNPAISDEIHIYTRSDICGAAATWSSFLGGTQDDLLGDGKFGDPGMVQAVQKDPLGIGYNNLVYAYGLGDVAPQGTVILPIDLNTNGQADPDEILDTRQKAAHAVASGLYPAPPSRELYLVTNGKPDGILQAFLEWALTDGQAYVERSGYVKLTDEQLGISLEKNH